MRYFDAANHFQPKTFIRDLLPAAALSLASCFMLFLYAPLELYCNNISEFWFDIYTLTPYMMLTFVLFFVFSVMLMALLLFVSEKLYNICLAMYAAGFLATYVQGNFLVSFLPSFVGNAIDWSAFAVQRYFSAAVWLIFAVLIGIAVFVLKWNRFKTSVMYVSSGIGLMLLITLVTVILTTGSLSQKKYSLYSDNMMEASSDKSFILLLFDTLDANTFEEVLANHPEYYDNFSDFTCYSNAMSGYPLTNPSVPMLISGKWYENQESYSSFLHRAYTESEFLNALQAQDYSLSIYDIDAPDEADFYSMVDNAYASNSQLSSPARLIALQLKLVGFRYAPFDLKRFCVFDTAEFYDLRSDTMRPVTFDYSNLVFEELLDTGEFTVHDNRVFKFIHLDGSHAPSNTKLVDGVITEDTDGFGCYNEVELSMFLAERYLETLKQNDCYDNSAIVILSDHGAEEPEYDFYKDPVALLRRATPVFFAKGFGERHYRMQLCDMPVSYIDASQAFLRLLDGSAGDNIFDFRGDDYTRRYLAYIFDNGSGTDLDTLYEYMVTGDPSDNNSFVRTGVSYPKYK